MSNTWSVLRFINRTEFILGWLQVIIKSGFLLVAGISMSACAGLFDIGGMSWKEEVLLHDGSAIFVERSIERGGYGIAHQDRMALT